MLTETATRLVPARILEVLGNRVCIELPDGRVWATLALASHYVPVRDDVVLAAGGGEEYYVIGVLRATGPTVITSSGDLTLLAPRGSVRILSTEGVAVKSRFIRLQAGSIEMLARSLSERFSTAYTWVKENLNLRAGRMRTVVKESTHLSAGRIVERARKDVTIDGDSINLG
jgi:hypothetical protein